MTEQELIKGCIDKRQDYQKLLFERYSAKMMSVCLRYANDEHRAKDILQEGFIRVFKYIHQYRSDGSFEGWLRRVFVSVATRQMAKEKMLFTEVDLSDESYTSIDPSVVSKISEDEIHVLIRSMPEGYRTVFNLAVIEGYSHEEIALMLEIRPTTSRGQLLKARRHLQRLILKKYNTVKI